MNILIISFLWLQILSMFSGALADMKMICSADLYGKPDPNDCRSLYPRIADFQDRRPRLFVEQDLRIGPRHSWRAASNPLAAPIVQVPKYWSLNSCNIALLPHKYHANNLAGWGSIFPQGICLIDKCVRHFGDGGIGHISVASQFHPILIMAIWQTGAIFEEAFLNHFQNDPDPTQLPDLLTLGSSNGTTLDAKC